MTTEQIPKYDEGQPESQTLAAPLRPLVEALPRGTTEPAQASAQTMAGASTADADKAADFLWNTHNYLNEYIRFSDTKAGVVVVLASGIIAAMYAAKLHVGVLGKWPSQWHWLDWLATSSFALLAATVALAVWAIKPRLTNDQSQGFVFWNSIRGFRSASDFWSAFRAQSVDGMAEHLSAHLFTLAGVCKRKYFWVALSIWVALVGAASGAAAVLLKDVVP